MKHNKLHFTIRLFVLCCFCITGLPVIMADTHSNKQPVGNLFTTPLERHLLNRLRQGLKQNTKKKKKKTDYLDKLADLDKNSRKTLQLNGIVTRSNGQVYAWIGNKQIKIDGKKHKLVIIKDKNSQTLGIQLTLPRHANKVHLKPGQTYMIENKWIVESYSVPGLISSINIYNKTRKNKRNDKLRKKNK